MRSEIGSMTLDQSLKERATLNARITQAVNEATEDWGVRVMRCKFLPLISLHAPRSDIKQRCGLGTIIDEIKNLNPPESVINSMHLQVSAERTKRAQILEAEGEGTIELHHH